MSTKLPDAKIIDLSRDAIHHTLTRVMREPRLKFQFGNTEAHAKLITAMAAIKNRPRFEVAADYQAMHIEETDYGLPKFETQKFEILTPTTSSTTEPSEPESDFVNRTS